MVQAVVGSSPIAHLSRSAAKGDIYWLWWLAIAGPITAAGPFRAFSAVRGLVFDNRPVPRLAAFYEIVIWMYLPDHPPPSGLSFTRASSATTASALEHSSRWFDSHGRGR